MKKKEQFELNEDKLEMVSGAGDIFQNGKSHHNGDPDVQEPANTDPEAGDSDVIVVP